MTEKTLEERRRALELRQDQIKEQLRRLAARQSAADRKLDTRRKIIAGALVIGAAETTPHHKDWLLGVLRNAPRRPNDAAIIDGLIEALEHIGPANQQE